jgi:hypothetical protein
VDLKLDPKQTFRRNYRSTAGQNSEKVENRLKLEISEGRYIRTSVRPTVISTLGAVPKDLDDIRLIHDLSRPDGGVNAIMAIDTSVAYTTIDEVTRHIRTGSYIAKIDLKNAYRSIPINRSCFKLTGMSWKFTGDSDLSYFFDSRLPFGAAKSCSIFQRITESLCRMMEKRGHVERI